MTESLQVRPKMHISFNAFDFDLLIQQLFFAPLVEIFPYSWLVVLDDL